MLKVESEITIHNFEKRPQIKIRVLSYGRQPIPTVYLFPLQRSRWYILLYTTGIYFTYGSL